MAQADIVELSNGDILTGEVRAMDNGQVTLAASQAYAPLEIKAEAVKKIVFPGQDKGIPTHTERLTLANNDVIPCKVLSMDDTNLNISTWYAGKFSIPRTKIKGLQFGISDQQTVYTGDDDPSNWSTRQGSWARTKAGYSCKGSGTLARKLDLPENVRFNFDLSWKEKPNFSFRFCGENDSSTTKQNTYEFLINSAGMQINRYENKKQPAATLANIPIKPHSLPGHKVNIDLRVNRTDGLITLYIDGNLIDTWSDTFAPPKGQYIILNSRTSRTTDCVIDNIQVSGLNDGALPRHRGKSLTSSTDVLVDSEGEKISGAITSISEGEPNKRTIIFDAPHSKTPMRVPDRRVSTLFFAQKDDAPTFPSSTFTAMLEGNGSIQLDNPRLIDGKIISQHPILGACTIDTKALAHIQQSTTEAKAQKTK